MYVCVNRKRVAEGRRREGIAERSKRTGERKEIPFVKALKERKRKKKKEEKHTLLAMTRRERTYQSEGDVDDLIK